MFFILLGILPFIIWFIMAIVIRRKVGSLRKAFAYVLEDTMSGFICIGLFLLIVFGSIFCGNQFFGKSNLNQYEVDKAYIESCYDNTNLTSEERLSLIKKIDYWNSRILNNRSYNRNFFFGIYYYKPIVDLNLFDITRIKNPKFNIGVENYEN